MRAIFILPDTQELREGEIDMSLESLQEAVGGDIEPAHEFENGDVLYVNAEGLILMEDALHGREDAARAFMFDVGAHQPFAGRGVIVGAEDEHGRHGSAVTPMADVAARLSFLAPPLAVAEIPGTIH